jgi:Family of unknown function (DUF6188)
MNPPVIQELEDRWILGLRGSCVDSVSRGAELTVGLDTGVQIKVGGSALLTIGPVTVPGAALTQVSDVPRDQLEQLVGARVLSAVAFKSGSLRVVFSTRYHLNVRSADPAATAEILKPGSFEWSYSPSGVKMNLLDRHLPWPAESGPD